MVLADFLAILDIIVTVLIGFVITHMVSVRDSRTRAIKDYYIQELADIKSEINDFYSKLFKGELGAQDIIGWYSAIRNRIDNFDNAVRKTFRIYEANIAQKVFYNYKFITNSTDFNANYNNDKIKFKAATKIAIGKNQKQLYMLIERTLYDINNVRARDHIERKWLEFKSHYLYYRITGKKTKKGALMTISFDWLNSHKSSIIALLLLLGLMWGLFAIMGLLVKQEKKEAPQIEQFMRRLDSLNAGIKGISDKINGEPPVIELPSSYTIRMNETTTTDTTLLRGWIKATK